MSVTFRRLFTAAGAVFLLVLSSQPAGAAVDRTHSYSATRVDHAPQFDPALSDPLWQKAVTASDFHCITTRRPASLNTTAYLLYDDTNLYVGFRAAQDGIPIHAEHTTNDVGFGQDDAVGIGVDTSGAGSQVYYFEATPRGVRYQQASESTRYAPPWQAKASVNGSQWTAMFVIPMKDLRAAGGKSKTWRFNFIRIVAGVGEHYTWAYDGLMQDGQPPNWPFYIEARFWPALDGLVIAQGAARPQPRAELYGLESVGKDRNVFQQANNTFATQTVRNYGMDFTYPMTSTIAAVGTLNPDFSNVEVDQQTIVPQEFQRNLAEYRPFFAQGAQFFIPAFFTAGGVSSAPYQTFYTPSIGTFDRGAKVEGTYGEQAIGALSVRGLAADGSRLDDQAFGYKHAGSDRSFVYWADAVLAHHGIGNDSMVESGLVNRNLKSGFLWSFDQVLEQRRLVTDPAQVFSFIRNGFIDVHKPNFEWNVGYQDVSPNYGPLDGFTPVSDARGPSVFSDFTASTPGLKSWTGFFGVDRYMTRSGIVHQADFVANEDIVTNKLVHVNVSQATSELNDPFLTGGVALPFNQTALNLGFRDGTPTPVDLFYGAGQFATFYLQQFNVTSTRPLGTRLNLSTTYAGTHERSALIGVDGQILRSIALGESFGPDTNVTLALRSINGNGGFALPGVNFAAGFHERFHSGSELFVNYGTPAASVTLNRLIVKYLWRIGGGAGT